MNQIATIPDYDSSSIGVMIIALIGVWLLVLIFGYMIDELGIAICVGIFLTGVVLLVTGTVGSNNSYKETHYALKELGFSEIQLDGDTFTGYYQGGLFRGHILDLPGGERGVFLENELPAGE